MTTLTITLDDEKAERLKKILIEEDIINVNEEKSVDAAIGFIQKQESSFERIKRILEEAKGKNLFKDIEDPSEWQREIRKEWDRDF